MSVKYLCLILTVIVCVPHVAGFFSEIFTDILCKLGFTKQCEQKSCEDCCDDHWLSLNIKDLRSRMNSKLYGQNLAVDTVVKYIESRNKRRRPVVLSFHGSTGTGKTYLSRLLAEALFQKGIESKHVIVKSAELDFKHESETETYKDILSNMIESKVKECPYSMFIFEETHLMPIGIFDTLLSYLDFTAGFSNATFVFLSNSASNEINKLTLAQRRNGTDRMNITFSEMENVIMQNALNEPGGFWHSNLITRALITAFVPLLPLERTHVKKCIKDGLIRMGYYETERRISEYKVQEIADQLQYFPEDELFSVNGCKRVDDKINYIMEDNI